MSYQKKSRHAIGFFMFLVLLFCVVGHGLSQFLVPTLPPMKKQVPTFKEETESHNLLGVPTPSKDQTVKELISAVKKSFSSSILFVQIRRGNQILGDDTPVEQSDIMTLNGSEFPVLEIQKLEKEWQKGEIDSDSSRVVVTGSGDIKGVLTSPSSNSGASGATGSLGIKYENSGDFLWICHGITVSAVVSIASTNDTLSNNYGHSLLVPKTGRVSGVLDALINLNSSNVLVWFLHPYFFLNTTTWAITDTVIKKTNYPEGSVLAYGLLGGLTLFKIPQSKDSRDAGGVAFEVGVSGRHLGGDIARNRDFMMMSINTNQRTFWLMEFGFRVFYKNITSALTYYQHVGPDDVPGFSGGQVAGGVSIQIEIASL